MSWLPANPRFCYDRDVPDARHTRCVVNDTAYAGVAISNDIPTASHVTHSFLIVAPRQLRRILSGYTATQTRRPATPEPWPSATRRAGEREKG